MTGFDPRSSGVESDHLLTVPQPLLIPHVYSSWIRTQIIWVELEPPPPRPLPNNGKSIVEIFANSECSVLVFSPVRKNKNFVWPKTKSLSSHGQVVSLLTFYSNYPSSNPAEVYSFYCVKIALVERNLMESRP